MITVSRALELISTGTEPVRHCYRGSLKERWADRPDQLGWLSGRCNKRGDQGRKKQPGPVKSRFSTQSSPQRRRAWQAKAEASPTL
jgi:hypothetical protein